MVICMVINWVSSQLPKIFFIYIFFLIFIVHIFFNFTFIFLLFSFICWARYPLIILLGAGPCLRSAWESNPNPWWEGPLDFPLHHPSCRSVGHCTLFEPKPISPSPTPTLTLTGVTGGRPGGRPVHPPIRIGGSTLHTLTLLRASFMKQAFSFERNQIKTSDSVLQIFNENS